MSIVLIGWSQKDSIKSNKLHCRFIQIQNGLTFSNIKYTTKQDFQSLLINSNSNSYYADSGYKSTVGTIQTSDFGIKINGSFSVGENQNQFFKLGLGLVSATYYSYDSYKEKITRIDTIKSSSGVYVPIYLDSVIKYNYGISTNVGLLSLDFEYGIQSSQRKYFIGSLGARVSPFYSIMNTASEHHSTLSQVRVQSFDIDGSNVGKYTFAQPTNYKIKASYGIILSVPMALNFKPKKSKHQFVKNSGVGIEVSPDLRITKLPSQAISSNFSFTAHVSYRYYFNN